MTEYVSTDYTPTPSIAITDGHIVIDDGKTKRTISITKFVHHLNNHAALVKGLLEAENYLDQILNMLRDAKMSSTDWRSESELFNFVKALAAAKKGE